MQCEHERMVGIIVGFAMCKCLTHRYSLIGLQNSASMQMLPVTTILILEGCADVSNMLYI